jgi:drug/metabolite transporter (DMT)-like permease
MYRGVLLLLLAELCFAVATVFVKLATSYGNIPAIEITFFRFFLGVFIAYAAMRRSKISFTPNNKKLVVMRGVLNTIALICFFTSVKYTTITNANMLNMTYPVFIFLFLPLFSKEKIKRVQWLYLLLSITGIYMVIQPNFSNLLFGDIIGLASGISGGLAIMTLRQARKFDSTALILFYLMLIGTVINGALLATVFVMPDSKQWVWIIASALLGVAGQTFLTSGYKFIEAEKGSIVSTSRIVFAFGLGWIFFNERINAELIAGAVLIIFSVVSLTLAVPKETVKS